MSKKSKADDAALDDAKADQQEMVEKGKSGEEVTEDEITAANKAVIDAVNQKHGLQ